MKHIKPDFRSNVWVDLGGGAEAKMELLQNMIVVHIKLKRMAHEATWQHIFYPYTPPSGSKDQNSTFSEYVHVAYQIKENNECSNMVVNILPLP